jgi:uncharacterized cupin superfamily protein
MRALIWVTRPSSQTVDRNVITFQPTLASRWGYSLFSLTRAFSVITRQIGVNLTRIAPGRASSLRHSHVKQDEFIFILAGTPTLVTDAERTALRLGMCAGFRAGTGDAHHLLKETAEDVVYLEVGDRSRGDHVTYPDDDIAAVGVEGGCRFVHKDGSPY